MICQHSFLALRTHGQKGEDINRVVFDDELRVGLFKLIGEGLKSSEGSGCGGIVGGI